MPFFTSTPSPSLFSFTPTSPPAAESTGKAAPSVPKKEAADTQGKAGKKSDEGIITDFFQNLEKAEKRTAPFPEARLYRETLLAYNANKKQFKADKKHLKSAQLSGAEKSAQKKTLEQQKKQLEKDLELLVT